MQNPKVIKPNGKNLYDLNDVFAYNTDQEISRELYVDGSTAMYTKRIQEINEAIRREDEAKRARRLALEATRKAAEEAARKQLEEEECSR